MKWLHAFLSSRGRYWSASRSCSRPALDSSPQALRSQEVAALLVVTPISERHISILRDFFPASVKDKPGLIPIESARAVANMARAYESYELPKGTVRGSPPIPDHDLTTLRVPIYLVANKKLDDDEVADLTQAIMEALAKSIREARSEGDLAAVEEQIDNIVRAELVRRAKGESRSADSAALSLTAQRLEHLINHRRAKLRD